MLAADPTKRPNMQEIMADEFFTGEPRPDDTAILVLFAQYFICSFHAAGFMPNSLPTSCLTMAPRFDILRAQEMRRPLLEVNGASGQ